MKEKRGSQIAFRNRLHIELTASIPLRSMNQQDLVGTGGIRFFSTVLFYVSVWAFLSCAFLPVPKSSSQHEGRNCSPFALRVQSMSTSFPLIVLACVAGHRKGGESKWARGGEAILPRPIFSRFTRSSFLFPSPSDACHVGYTCSLSCEPLYSTLAYANRF